MEDLSEEAIKINCPHCNLNSQAYTYLLEQTDNFSIVCDANPIREGHILIIPKKHVSCIAEYPENVYKEFLELNSKVSEFIFKEYGSVSSFEHGVFGQTVFHSHVHYMPFNGKPADIVYEGDEKLKKIEDLADLKAFFKKDGGYLFFSIGTNLWVVDSSIAAPRFFRDRFAKALNRPERGNWKEMRANKQLLEKSGIDGRNTQLKWSEYFS